MILIVPYLNMSLEFLVAMIRGGSSFECLLPFALAVLFSANFIFLPACVELLFLLCDKFAAPCFSSNILDCMQTLLIHLLFMVFAVGGLGGATVAYRNGLLAAVSCSFIFLLLLLGLLKVKHSRRKIKVPSSSQLAGE